MSDGEQILGRPKLDIYTPYDFETANKAYAAEYRFSQDNINRGARSRTAIITCIDSRSTPEHFFELKENEAFSIRNGGGRTSDPGTIRSLMLIQCHTELKEIKVVHHSNCGSLYYTDEWVREQLAKNDPQAAGGPYKEGAAAWADTMATLPFTRKGEGERERDIIERSVREDVQFLRDHPLIKPSVLVTGWFFNMHNGRAEPVE